MSIHRMEAPAPDRVVRVGEAPGWVAALAMAEAEAEAKGFTGPFTTRDPGGIEPSVWSLLAGRRDEATNTEVMIYEAVIHFDYDTMAPQGRFVVASPNPINREARRS